MQSRWTSMHLGVWMFPSKLYEKTFSSFIHQTRKHTYRNIDILWRSCKSFSETSNWLLWRYHRVFFLFDWIWFSLIYFYPVEMNSRTFFMNNWWYNRIYFDNLNPCFFFLRTVMYLIPCVSFSSDSGQCFCSWSIVEEWRMVVGKRMFYYASCIIIFFVYIETYI